MSTKNKFYQNRAKWGSINGSRILITLVQVHHTCVHTMRTIIITIWARGHNWLKQSFIYLSSVNNSAGQGWVMIAYCKTYRYKCVTGQWTCHWGASTSAIRMNWIPKALTSVSYLWWPTAPWREHGTETSLSSFNELWRELCSDFLGMNK